MVLIFDYFIAFQAIFSGKHSAYQAPVVQVSVCSHIFGNSLILLYKKNPSVYLKIVYSYVIEVAESESDLGWHDKALVSKIFVFLRIRMIITIENAQNPQKLSNTLKTFKTLKNSYNSRKHQKEFLIKVITAFWSTQCIFQKMVKCKYLRNKSFVVQTTIIFGISDLDYA